MLLAAFKLSSAMMPAMMGWCSSTAALPVHGEHLLVQAAQAADLQAEHCDVCLQSSRTTHSAAADAAQVRWWVAVLHVRLHQRLSSTSKSR